MANDIIRYELCQINELHNGEMKEFEIKISNINSNILLIKQNNKFYAYSNKCCHYKLPLIKGVLINNHLRCFAHGACFRVDTGDIEDHPGHGNLPKYDVEIVKDRVILVAKKEDFENLERIKIPENLEIEARPIVAIIGAGAGGFTCADMLRQNGFYGRIILFTREGVLPYDRVQLSKQPTKNVKDLLLRDEFYFKKAKIDLFINTEVTNINWSNKNLTYKTLNDQQKSLQYDYLVLATGLRPRKLPSSIPGYNLQNIFYLRSLEDANNLVHQIKLSETKNIVIIGDSFIALEFCGWLTTGLNEKKNISVIMRSKIPMIRIFGERIGCALQKIHEKNGAKFYSETNVIKIIGENNRVKYIQLATGDLISCDLVFVAIGSELCTELYQNSLIKMTDEGFIKVNQYLQTSVEHVLAVGDICKYPLRVFNLDDINCQHWQMACSTGHHAANTILHNHLGERKVEFYTVPIYWTTQNDKITIRYVGYTRDPENVIIHGDIDDQLKFVAYYIVNGYVRAVAQSKYEPLTSEIAEIFYHKYNIREEDIQNDIYGYKKYLHLINKKT